jgi:hypothetical protein
MPLGQIDEAIVEYDRQRFAREIEVIQEARR